MKKSILILFVLLSQVCLGQIPLSMDGNGSCFFKGVKVPCINSEYYYKQDSTIAALKMRLDSLEADYDKILYKLILNEAEKLKK